MKTPSDELSIGETQELMSAAAGDRAAVRWRGRTLTHTALTDRTRRFANILLAHGLGRVVPRSELAPWESGQDFVAILMHNRPEFLEATLGALKARSVPYNVNYRYRVGEMRELFGAAPTCAVVYDAVFAPAIDELRKALPAGTLLIEVDGPGEPLVQGAIGYEAALASSSADAPAVNVSPDDLYVIFTGGTTGRPKAVMWRQTDAIISALQVPTKRADDPRPVREAIVDGLAPSTRVVLPTAPFMHAAGQWTAIGAILAGATVAIQDVVDHLDCADVWSTVEREHVRMMLIAGNAFGAPLLEELRRRTYDVSSLRILLTGGVAMTDDVKAGFLQHVPGLRIVETMGATEAGIHMRSNTTEASGPRRTFAPSDETALLDEHYEHRLEAGHEGTGWIARSGRIPLGYLGDRERTETVFRTVDGVRYAIAGDRGRILPSGLYEVLGRDSVTINSGGEKIFVEEVELALLSNPAVHDAVVTGKDHPRWGQEVVALVSLRPGKTITAAALAHHVSSTLARYKVPKRIVFVDRVRRNDFGKPDYAWAREQAAALQE